MIPTCLKYALLLASTFVFAACADPHNLDKTVRNSSILKGKKVTELSPVYRRTAFLVQHLDLTTKNPVLFGICSGLVLDSRTILTAAHCLEQGIDGMKIVLKADPRSDLDEANDVYSVIDSRQHPEFISNLKKSTLSLEEIKNNADLALIYLDRNIADTRENFDPSKLAPLTDGTAVESTPMLVTGFGRTTALNDLTGISFSEVSGFVNQAWVDVSVKDLNSSHFLVSQKNSGGVCFGDSGGPAFIQTQTGFKAIAIAVGVYEPKPKEISAVLGRAKENACAGFGLYLNIQYYQSWIDENQKDLQKANI